MSGRTGRPRPSGICGVNKVKSLIIPYRLLMLFYCLNYPPSHLLSKTHPLISLGLIPSCSSIFWRARVVTSGSIYMINNYFASNTACRDRVTNVGIMPIRTHYTQTRTHTHYNTHAHSRTHSIVVYHKCKSAIIRIPCLYTSRTHFYLKCT